MQALLRVEFPILKILVEVVRVFLFYLLFLILVGFALICLFIYILRFFDVAVPNCCCRGFCET